MQKRHGIQLKSNTLQYQYWNSNCDGPAAVHELSKSIPTAALIAIALAVHINEGGLLTADTFKSLITALPSIRNGNFSSGENSFLRVSIGNSAIIRPGDQISSSITWSSLQCDASQRFVQLSLHNCDCSSFDPQAEALHVATDSSQRRRRGC